MTFGEIDHYISGVSAPVSALRSLESCGIGEFADLPAFARWAAGAGLELIQLLPVNDTGSNSSPYSAISAFALHPIYVRLQDLPGAGRYASEIGAYREKAELLARVSYHDVLSFKSSMLWKLFQDNEKTIRTDRAFSSWRAANPWVIPYAAYKTLKEAAAARAAEESIAQAAAVQAAEASQAQTVPPAPGDAGAPVPQIPQYTDALASSTWKTEERRCLMHAWVQFALEAQLSAASRACASVGVHLKGDIPILMNQDSADVWSRSGYFDLSRRAGAPPDMYSTEGQNWGFPVYNWDALAADGYSWWKGRLLSAAKFFHAFRIDHVLGFFRIWAIPRGECRGLLGRFSPSQPITRRRLMEAGFDAGRIAWLSLRHVGEPELRDRVREDSDRIRDTWFDRVGTEALFTLKPELDSECRILQSAEPAHIRDFLLAVHADRALLPIDGDVFAPCWYFWTSTAFKSLTPEEPERLRALISACRRESEEIWENRGMTLLKMLRGTTDMLVCAEDLGDVPECVPRVLSALGILGLRISRWAREYKAPGSPFIPPESFPRLSVCTASVHDTSTLRAWWEENPAEREAYFRHLGMPGACPEKLDRGLLLRIVEQMTRSSSLLCILQLQDILDMDQSIWSPDPREDRINVPGTVNDWNWGWRMPLTLEELSRRREPAAALAALAAARRERPLS